MSCGDPHATGCRDVIEEVYLYLDGELNEEDRHKVRTHLDECSPCLRQYGLEQSVKALVARCCGGDAAPAELRERVMIRLQEVRVSIDHMEFRAE